ncbi:hypothetical protein GOP47_0027590 [Adiantum capillus-veneris]|nr:hypothetical protein GOP47_0027590 [Adiantum capillus-veneris]
MAIPPPDFTSYGAGADLHDRLPSPASSISHHVEGDCSTGYGVLDPAPAPASSPLPLNELIILHYDPDCTVSRLLESPVCTCCLRVFERSPSIIGFINASPSPPSKPEHLQCHPFQPENMSGPTTSPTILNCNLQASDILIIPPSPFPPDNIWAGHVPRVCEGFEGEMSALDRQGSFNFSLLDETNNEINLWDLLPPAPVMEGEMSALDRQGSFNFSLLDETNNEINLWDLLPPAPVMEGEMSALDRQGSFNFSLLDETNNEINLWDLLPPAPVMDGCTDQNAGSHGVDQVSQLETTVCDLDQHFNHPKSLQLQSCPMSSPASMKGMVTGGISGPILSTECLSNVTPSSSLFYRTSNLHLEPSTLPAPFYGVTAEQSSHESFYEVEDMGSVHGRNEVLTRLIETEICGRIGMLACGGQAGGMKPKEQPRASISPSPFHGVAAEDGPQESFLEVYDMGPVHGGNQAATRLNKTEFYRKIDRFAWRKHGQPLGIKAKKRPRCMSIPARACGGVFEDKDHICDGKKVNLRVKTENIILDDGFLWLKYGQKPINGHTHPRSYLRCAWSGCKAQKRVQRCSTIEDFVDFLYLGRHNHSH